MARNNSDLNNGSIWAGISKYKHFEMRDADNETIVTVTVEGDKSSISIKNGYVTTFTATVDGDQYKEYGNLKAALRDLRSRMKPKNE